jgi:hypothetical protein
VADGGSMDRIDRVSALSSDLFQLICENLNSFDLARFASVSRDARTQVDAGAFAQLDKVDLSRFAAANWPDWRMLRMVARFPATSSLSFRNTRFRSFGELASVCFGRQIRQLSFAGCSTLQDVHLSELFDMGEHLQTLDLAGCENLTDDGLEHIATARHNRSLTKLNLSECKHISSTGVIRVLERCIGLQSLDLKGTHVTKSILAFTQQESSLTWLNLSACKKLPADLVISSPFCQLQWINLAGNPGLKSVTLSIPSLTTLNCSNSKHMQSLTMYAPRLKQLQLNGCLLLSVISSVSHQSKVLLTSLEEANFNLCRSITSLSFQQIFASARTTLRTLSCRGCLLLSDANIAILLPDKFSEASGGYSMLAPSSASAQLPATLPLEFVDLSGCKAALPSNVLLASRMVADSNAIREAASNQQQQAHASAYEWVRAGRSKQQAGGGLSSSDEEHSGGLDDDDQEPLDA